MSTDNPDIASSIALVRLRAEAALVRRMNAGYGFADARIPAEVFLRDEQARERMGRNSLRPQDSHLAQAQELSRAIAEAEAALEGREDPLTLLGQRFQLDRAEQALLSIAIAYELDRDTRDLCHALAWRRRSTLFADICQDIAPELASGRDMLRVLHPSGTLRRSGLILVERARTPGQLDRVASGRELAISRRVLDFLLEDRRIAEPLRLAMSVFSPEYDFRVHIADAVQEQVLGVCEHLRQAAPGPTTAVLIQGVLGAGKRAVAHHLARSLGRPLAHISLVNVINLMHRQGDTSLMYKALSEATMRGAVAYLPGIDSLGKNADSPGVDDHTRAVIDAIDQNHDLMVLATTERRMPSLPVSRPFHLVRLPSANLEIRQKAWKKGLAAIAQAAGRSELDERAAEDLAARYVIGPGTVGEVVADALALPGPPAARSSGRASSKRSVGAYPCVWARLARSSAGVRAWRRWSCPRMWSRPCRT